MKKILIIILALALNFTGTRQAPCMQTMYMKAAWSTFKSWLGFGKIQPEKTLPEKKLTDLPDEMITHIISYNPEEFINYALINKQFRNTIFEEKEDGSLVLKVEFLRALIGVDQTTGQDGGTMSPQEKATRLWTFVCQTGYRPALDHYQAIVGQPIDYNLILDQTTQERPLHIAAQYNKRNIIRLLLNCDANINAQTNEHLKPIHVAIKSGQVETFNILRRRTLNWINVTNPTIAPGQPNIIYNPGHLAALSNNKEMLDEMSKRFGRNLRNALTQANINGKKPLDLAIENGCINTLEWLDEKNILTIINNPLEKAVRANQPEVVEWLHRKGANIHHIFNNDKNLVSIAAELGHANMLKILVKKYGVENKHDHDDCNPLLLAIRNGHIDVVQTLVNELGVTTQSPLQLLIYAIEKNQDQMANFLIKEFNIDVTSALFDFEYFNELSPEALETLINLGANPHLRDNKTTLSLLERAIEVKDLGQIQFIIQIPGFNINDLNNENKRSALMFIAQENYNSHQTPVLDDFKKAVIKILLDHGTDKTLQNSYGKTAYDLYHESKHYSPSPENIDDFPNNKTIEIEKTKESEVKEILDMLDPKK